jgi:hypothetical protein
MRFVVTENRYGRDEIAASRKHHSPANLARTILRLDIVTFGRHDCGSITVEFQRSVDERAGFGRQSQVWVRLQKGWRLPRPTWRCYVNPVTLTQLEVKPVRLNQLR